MKFLLLILVVAPIYAANEVFGDLLGQDFAPIERIREKRQAQKYRPINQAPAHVQQILAAQDVRAPLVHLPPVPPPKLGPAQPIQPQQLSQTQVSAYRPQVSYSGGAQQPNYKNIQNNPAQYKKPIYPQQPQYRPNPVNNYPQQQRAEPNYNAPRTQYHSQLTPELQQLLQYQKQV